MKADKMDMKLYENNPGPVTAPVGKLYWDVQMHQV